VRLVGLDNSADNCLFFILCDSCRLPLPVGSFVLFMQPSQPSAHMRGAVAAEVTNGSCRIKKGPCIIVFILS